MTSRLLSLEDEGKVIQTLRKIEKEARDNRRVSFLLNRPFAAHAWGFLAEALFKARKDLERDMVRKDATSSE